MPNTVVRRPRPRRAAHAAAPARQRPHAPPQARSKAGRVLIYAMNYAPELIGVGKYTGEIGAYLAARGFQVEVVTTAPHYPDWQARAPYDARRYSVERQRRIRITRCPIALAKSMRGLARAWAPLSFALSSAPIAIWRILTTRPDAVLCVEPTLAGAPAALLAAKLIGARTVLHVQDLEIDAAFTVGHLKGGIVRRAAKLIDRLLLGVFDDIVTISTKMAKRLEADGVPPRKLALVRNWVHLDRIFPMLGPNRYRKELGLSENAFVALYSGSLGAKQALHVVMDAASALQRRDDIVFVIAGDGPERAKLMAQNLSNVRFLPLQPAERLCEFLNLANVHLLPQSAGADDLVLPSKLGGMLASGKPIIAQSEPGAELHAYLAEDHTVVAPGCARSLADAITAQVGRKLTPSAVRASCADLDAVSNLDKLRAILTAPRPRARLFQRAAPRPVEP